MSRVLVTGATGFVGRNVIKPLLDRGFEVHAVARRAPVETLPGVRWHEADLLDPHARHAVVRAAAASHLLHLAWYAEPGRFWTASENVLWVSATGDLLAAFAAAGGQRAVIAGTCAEYDWEPGGVLSEQTTPLRPATLYGTSKDAARRLAQSLAAQAAVDLVWGRIFFLYGPGEHPDRLVSSVARALVAGRRAPVTEGLQMRDFMFVDDVAGAFAALVGSEVEGPVNIGSGEAVAVRDLVHELARRAGREDLLDIGAVAQRPGEPLTLVAACQRLHDEVGFAAATTLGDGLARTLDWWRAAS